jgi:Ca2+-binding EF-hand superfamily protein
VVEAKTIRIPTRRLKTREEKWEGWKIAPEIQRKAEAEMDLIQKIREAFQWFYDDNTQIIQSHYLWFSERRLF